MKREITAEDFDFTEKPIEASGRWLDLDYNDSHFSINYSDILTRLIKSAGMHCEHFASDLFIDWSNLQKRLCNKEYKGEKLLFGMRENGVDGNIFVLCKYNNPLTYDIEKEYKEIFLLDIQIEQNKYYRDPSIKMLFNKAKLNIKESEE